MDVHQLGCQREALDTLYDYCNDLDDVVFHRLEELLISGNPTGVRIAANYIVREVEGSVLSMEESKVA